MGKKRAFLGVIVAIVVLLAGGAIVYWNIGLSAYNQAISAHQALDAETALAKHQKVIRYYPASLFTFARLSAQDRQVCEAYWAAHQTYQGQDYARAVDQYTQFLAQYPTDRLVQLVAEEHPAAYLAWAREADRSGSFLTAVERYKALSLAYPSASQAAEANQAIPIAYYHEGDEQRSQAKYPTALDAYRAVKEADPASSWAAQAQIAVRETFWEWGDALRAAGEYETAIARYQDTLAESDDAAAAAAIEQAIGSTYLEWAKAILESQGHQAAIDLGNSAIAAFPQSGWREEMHAFIHATYLQWAEQLYARQEFKAAIATYQTCLSNYPEVNPTAITTRIVNLYDDWADSARNKKQYLEALSVYEELMKTFPQNMLAQNARYKLPQLHYEWASFARAQKEYETAVQHYKTSIALEEQILLADNKIRPQVTSPKTYTVTVNTDSLNVRQGPGQDETVVGVVKRGERLTVMGRNEDGSWIQIEKPAGWVASSLVRSQVDILQIPLQVEPVPLKPAAVEASPTAAQAWEATAATLYEWGTEFYTKTEYAQAVNKFQTIIDEYALSQVITETRTAAGQAYLAWGDALSATQKYQDAAQTFARVLEVVDAKSAWRAQAIDRAAGAYLAWGNALQSQKLYSEAIAKYAVVYTDYAASAHVNAAYTGVISCYTQWGDGLRKEGKYSDAIQKYQAIVNGFPKSQAAGAAATAIGQTYNLWGAALHTQKKYADAMAKFSLAWQATSDTAIVTTAQKGYNDALWALARLTDATGIQIMSDALGTACIGKAAASPAVNLATNEAGKALCNSYLIALPADLKATMPAHFRYAVCATSGANEVQRCSYTRGHTLVRQQQWWKITVRNAKTGEWIAENTFYGSMPDSCPFSYVFYGTVAYMSGGSPSSADAINWLRGIVK